MTQPTDSTAALLALLDFERHGFMAQFDRVPPTRSAESPSEGVWSALQVAEHVARVEGGVARMIAKGPEMPRTDAADLAAALLTAQKIEWVRVRSTKVNAPERVHPTGQLTVDAVREQLAASRAAMLDAFHVADDAVLDSVTFPHPFIGPLTLRAWVELVAHHDARHADQMTEIVAHWSVAL